MKTDRKTYPSLWRFFLHNPLLFGVSMIVGMIIGEIGFRFSLPDIIIIPITFAATFLIGRYWPWWDYRP